MCFCKPHDVVFAQKSRYGLTYVLYRTILCETEITGIQLPRTGTRFQNLFISILRLGLLKRTRYLWSEKANPIELGSTYQKILVI